jgi:hypothetical protein
MPKRYMKCASCLDAVAPETLAGWYGGSLPNLKNIIGFTTVWDIPRSSPVHFMFYTDEISD